MELDKVSSDLECGWTCVSTTPILSEEDGGSYTVGILFLLETEYNDVVLDTIRRGNHA